MSKALKYLFSLCILLTIGIKGFPVMTKAKNKEVIFVVVLKDSNLLKGADFFRTVYTEGNWGSHKVTETGEIQRSTAFIKMIYKNLTVPGYINFNLEKIDNSGNAVYSFLVEPGDSVFITMKADSINKFSGRGSGKYNLLTEIQKIKPFKFQFLEDSSDSGDIRRVKITTSLRIPFSNRDESCYEILRKNQIVLEKIYQDQLRVVRQYKSKISQLAEWIIKTDLRFIYYQRVLRDDLMRNESYKSKDILDYVKFVAESKKSFDVRANEHDYMSKERIEYAILDAKIQQWTNNGLAKEKFTIDRLSNTFRIIDLQYNGYLRDAIEAKLLLMSFSDNDLKSVELIKSVEKRMPKSAIKDLLISFINKMVANVPAFAFALPDTSGNIVRLQDLRGKIVVVDFWFTGCGACQNVAREMKRAVVPAFFDQKDLVFVTISADKDIVKWKNSVRKGDYVKPGGIDLYTNGEGFNHPLIRHYNISGYPAFIVIGRDGKVISTDPPRPWTNDYNQATTIFINYLRNLLSDTSM